MSVPAEPEQPRRRIPAWILLVIGVPLAIAAVLSAVFAIRGTVGDGPGAATTPTATALEAALDSCDGAARLGDAGRTLIVDGRGEEDYDGEPLSKVVCYLKELNAPDSVISHMDSTRALDGRQTADWAGISAAWTYHPNQGMDLVLTLK